MFFLLDSVLYCLSFLQRSAPFFFPGNHRTHSVTWLPFSHIRSDSRPICMRTKLLDRKPNTTDRLRSPRPPGNWHVAPAKLKDSGYCNLDTHPFRNLTKSLTDNDSDNRTWPTFQFQRSRWGWVGVSTAIIPVFKHFGASATG